MATRTSKRCTRWTNLFRGAKDARILDKAWTELFGVKLMGSLPENYEDREIVVAAGEGHALLYFPTPVMSTDGRIERLDWKRRPGLQLLRDYPYSGGRVDVIAEGIAWKEAVAFMVGKDWDTGKVHVFSHLGESIITRQGTAPTRASYQYEVVQGEDPLGFANDPAIEPLMDGSFPSCRRVAEGNLPERVPRCHRSALSGLRC